MKTTLTGMTDKSFRAFLATFAADSTTLTQLKAVAKRLGLVGVDKYRVASKDELVALVSEAAEAFLGYALSDEVYETEVNESGTEVVGYVKKEHTKFVLPGEYRLTYVSQKGSDTGVHVAGFMSGKRKCNLFVTDHAYVRKCEENRRSMMRPVVFIDDEYKVTPMPFVDTIPNAIEDLPEEDFIIKVRQYGLTDDGQLPPRDVTTNEIDEEYQLNVPVKAIKLHSIYNEAGEITGIKPLWVSEMHPANQSPLFKEILEGNLIPVVFSTFSNEENYVNYVHMARRAIKDMKANGEAKEKTFLFGDPKKPIMYAGSQPTWERIFGQPLFGEDGYDKNPHKTWKAVVGTPRDFKTVGSTRKTFKLRLVEEQFIKYPSMTVPGVADKDVHGYKIHDGVIHTNGVKFRFLSGKNVRHNRGWKWANCTVQVRVYPGPALKGTMFGNKDEYLIECKHHGIDPKAQDGIASMDILKTQKGSWKPGDIMEIPIEDLAVIKLKMSDWSSSIGGQSTRLDPASVRSLYNETDAPGRAELLKDAMGGSLESIFDMLSYGGKADSWEDSKTLGAKFGIFARYSEELGDHRACMWSQNRSVLNARGMAFYREHVLKNKVMEKGYYLQASRILDELEEKTHQAKIKGLTSAEAKLVPFEYFAMLPKGNDFNTLLEDDRFINIGRNPLVGPGNVMGFTPTVKRNSSHDAILISSRAMNTMYADQDGDTLLVCPSQHTKFPTFVCPPSFKAKVDPKNVPVKPTVTTPEEYLENVVIPITYQAFKSASDVGVLDNLTRRIIFQRWWAGDPLSDDDRLEMGRIVEDAIGGLKHAGQGAQEDASDYIIRKFGVLDAKSGKRKVAPIKASSMDYLITRTDQGNREIKAQPAKQMTQLAENMKMVQFHPNNPFDVTLNKLRGLNVDPHHEDSVLMKERCASEWKAATVRIGKGAYPWRLSDITQFGHLLSTRYNAESAAIMRQHGGDKDERRKAFSKLYRDYVAAIEDHCMQRFGSLDVTRSVQFQRQLMFYVGMISFGARGNDSSFGGSCFWCFDMHRCLLWIARRWDKTITDGGYRVDHHPANSYIDLVEDAYIKASAKDKS